MSVPHLPIQKHILVLSLTASLVLPAAAQPLSFRACLEQGMRTSPQLRRSQTEIELRQLDERDRRAEFFPSLHLTTSYMINEPQDSESPWSLGVTTGPYDLITPTFSTRAACQITQIAVLAHRQRIAEGIQLLATAFLRVRAVDRAIAIQQETIALRRQQQISIQAAAQTSRHDPLDASIVERELGTAEMELARMRAGRVALLDETAAQLGFPLEPALDIDVRNAEQQIFGTFQPTQATLTAVQEFSTERAIRAIQRDLQELKIKAAYAEYFPTPFFNVRSTDPLDGKVEQGLYVSVGLNFELWDNGRRPRDVRRQKFVLFQYEMDEELSDARLTGDWRAAVNAYRIADMDRAIAESQEEIARLRAERSRIQYEAGSLAAAGMLQDSVDYTDARRNTLAKALDRDLALLRLAHLSGHLMKRFIALESFATEIPNE